MDSGTTLSPEGHCGKYRRCHRSPQEIKKGLVWLLFGGICLFFLVTYHIHHSLASCIQIPGNDTWKTTGWIRKDHKLFAHQTPPCVHWCTHPRCRLLGTAGVYTHILMVMFTASTASLCWLLRGLLHIHVRCYFICLNEFSF